MVEWPRLPEQQGPRADAFLPNEATEAEMTKNPMKATHVLPISNKPEVCLHNITDYTKINSFNKLLCVTV